jgi:copper chaperone CopZ
MKIVLKNVDGESITIDVKPEDTFYDLKTRIQNESGIHLDLEQLNFKGKKITDDQIVAEYFFEGLYEPLYEG